MTILVTGARGTVGGYFAALAPTFSEPLELVTSRDLDITEAASVDARIGRGGYSTVINLAAMTDLDRAEREVELARRVNALGAGNLARAAERAGAVMVQLSTIGVFGKDGALGPFAENDPPSPINVYAATKLEGEALVRSAATRAFVLRTAWIMGGGKNEKKFVGKLREKMLAGEPIRAVGDKVGSPTYARDLVIAIRELLETDAYGLYHVTNTGRASRYDIAMEMKRLLRTSSTVESASSDEFPLPAARPPSEVSNGACFEELGVFEMPPWEDALRRYLETLR